MLRPSLACDYDLVPDRLRAEPERLRPFEDARVRLDDERPLLLDDEDDARVRLELERFCPPFADDLRAPEVDDLRPLAVVDLRPLDDLRPLALVDLRPLADLRPLDDLLPLEADRLRALVLRELVLRLRLEEDCVSLLARPSSSIST
jgi:hypothetical protein